MAFLNKKILVVDDVPETREYLKRLIEARFSSFQIFEACSGPEVDHQISKHRFDLVLVDRYLGPPAGVLEDSVSLTRRLEEAGVPVLRMTGVHHGAGLLSENIQCVIKPTVTACGFTGSSTRRDDESRTEAFLMQIAISLGLTGG